MTHIENTDNVQDGNLGYLMIDDEQGNVIEVIDGMVYKNGELMGLIIKDKS